MKKTFLFLILVGGAVAAWWFYDPYLQPYLGPAVEKVKDKFAELTAKPERAPAPAETSPGAPRPEKAAPPAPAAPRPKTEPGPVAQPAPHVVETKQPEQSEIDKLVEERFPLPEILPLMDIVASWQKVPERAFPDQVAIQENLSFRLRAPSGETIGASVAVPGTLVKPIRLNDGILTVESLANASMRNEIHVDKTDFKQRVQQRYDDWVRKTNDRVRRQRDLARQVLLAKAEEDPGAISAIREAERPASDSSDPRFEPVKASLAAGEVRAATLEEAVAFRWNGQERINGDIHRGLYDTVSVKFEVRTIFGVFPNEFKCLLRDGKVEGWVDPLTMEEKI